MTRTVFHIGLMKTGTTYVQAILTQNREALAAAGWSYPGQRENQQHACYGLCGADIYWVAEDNPYQRAGARLARETSEHHRNVLISAEALSSLSEEGIERFLAKVGQPDAVILTVRSLEKLIPSAWQQSLKSGATETLDAFLHQLQDTYDSLDGLWRTYAFGDIARRWASFCPTEVVVVPRSQRTEGLWELFRAAAGLPALEHLSVEPNDANVSLSHEIAETITSLNRILTAEGYTKRQQFRIRNALLQKGVRHLDQDRAGTKITLPTHWHHQIRRWNDQQTELLVAHARTVHGSLPDLQVSVSHPDQPPEERRHSQVAAALLAELLLNGPS